MLYDIIRLQSDPAFAAPTAASYTQDGSGTTYVERNRRAVAAGTARPLQIVAASENEIYITSGLVNYSYYPTISGTPINNDPQPTIAISAQSWIWVKCVGTFGSPDTYVVTIQVTTSSTAPSSSAITGTGFTSCFLIGTVDVDGGNISAITNIFSGGNLGVESFGSTNMWWAT
jgi:hypothetical protein